MANKHRAEFEIRTKNAVYEGRFTTDAICNVEEKLNIGCVALFKSVTNPEEQFSIRIMRALLWAGIHQCDRRFTIEKCDPIIAELGIPKIIEITHPALFAALPSMGISSTESNPDAEEVNEKNGRRGRGTGKSGLLQASKQELA